MHFQWLFFCWSVRSQGKHYFAILFIAKSFVETHWTKHIRYSIQVSKLMLVLKHKSLNFSVLVVYGCPEQGFVIYRHYKTCNKFKQCTRLNPEFSFFSRVSQVYNIPYLCRVVNQHSLKNKLVTDTSMCKHPLDISPNHD